MIKKQSFPLDSHARFQTRVSPQGETPQKGAHAHACNRDRHLSPLPFSLHATNTLDSPVGIRWHLARPHRGFR